MPKLLVFLLLFLAGCSWPTLSPYKVDIQQGNYVDQEMVAKLKPGMSKSQVRFALGSPLIADAFHQDRWDYVFRQQKGGGVPEQRIVTAIFDGDRLVRLEGNVFISAEFRDPQAAIEQIERERQLPEPLGARVPGTLGPPPVALPASPPGAKPATAARTARAGSGCPAPASGARGTRCRTDTRTPWATRHRPPPPRSARPQRRAPPRLPHRVAVQQQGSPSAPLRWRGLPGHPPRTIPVRQPRQKHRRPRPHNPRRPPQRPSRPAALPTRSRRVSGSRSGRLPPPPPSAARAAPPAPSAAAAPAPRPALRDVVARPPAAAATR